MISRLRRWWARHRPRMRTLTTAEAAARLRSLADQVEEAIGTGGWLTIDDDLPTETRRPTMDLDMAATIDHLVARWRRYAEHLRRHPGQLTPADVYEECADALEARLRLHMMERQAGREGVAV